MELRHGAMRVDLIARTATHGAREVSLAPREFSVLAHLMRHADRAVGRRELLELVWRLPRDPGTNVVEVQMARLRSKLAHAGTVIETVRGQGYRFAG